MIEVSYHHVSEQRMNALVAFASHGDPVSGIGRVQNNGRKVALESSRKLSLHPWAVMRRLKRRSARMACVLLIAIPACADSATLLPPLPKVPKRLLSPRASGEMVNAPMVRGVEAVAPKRYWLTWKAEEYNQGSVEFDVERKLTLNSPWTKLITVRPDSVGAPVPPVEITQYPGFYRVGVHWK